MAEWDSTLRMGQFQEFLDEEVKICSNLQVRRNKKGIQISEINKIAKIMERKPQFI